MALNNLARSHHLYGGRPADAIDVFTEALALHRQTNRVAGVAVTLANLAMARWELSLHSGPELRQRGLDQAAVYLSEALTLHREIGDLRNEADTLRSLGCLRRDAGDVATALQLATLALTTARQAGDLRFEAKALSSLGTIHSRLGNSEQALNFARQSLRLARELEDRQLLVHVLLDAADTRIGFGHIDAALRLAEEARTVAVDVGSVPQQRDAQRRIAAITDYDSPAVLHR